MESLEGRLLFDGGLGGDILPFGPLRVNGTEGNDVIHITQSSGAITVELNGVTERHVGAFTDLQVRGLGGHDEIRFEGTLGMTAYGGPGDDVIVGGSGRNVLYGEDGHDTLRGGSRMYGTFDRGAMPDAQWFADRAMRGDWLDGGAGNDTIMGGDEGVWVRLDLGGLWAILPFYSGVPGDVIYGGDGNDTIYGGGGDDEIHGDAGRDNIYGEMGHDTIYGGDEFLGLWPFMGFPGKAVLQMMGLGGDVLSGGYGDDVIEGGDEWVALLMPDGRTVQRWMMDVPGDSISGDQGSDTIRGGQGDDWLAGLGGADHIWGGEGHDTLEGGIDGDELYGDGGNDTINGDAGNDVIWGGSGNDTIYCGTGTYHYVVADDGNDTVYGSDGVDDVWGCRGNDTIYGYGGEDTLNGNDGDDHVYGGGGADRIYGGLGADTLDGGTEDDRIYGGDGDDTITCGSGNDTAYGDLGDDTIDGDDGWDTLYGDQESGPSFLDGDDTIRGGLGNDTIFGQQGNDTIEGGAHDDTIDAGAGDDDVWGGSGWDTIDGGWGNDEIWGEGGRDEIDGGYGDDRIWGGEGNDLIFGDYGVDVIYGDDEEGLLTGDDTISGGWHDDYLYGGLGNDMLYGDSIDCYYGAGDDWLWGGAGNDRLVGGDGDDRLLGGSGMDALFVIGGHDVEVFPDDATATNEPDRIYTDTLAIAERWDNGADASFYVTDTRSASWSYEELYQVDDAIRLIHEANGSDTLIQTSDGGYVELIRERDCWWDGDVDGWNDGDAIHLCDSAVRAGALGVVTVHEMGHFWDTESPVWDDFLDESRWTRISHAGQSGWHYEYAYAQEWWWHDPNNFYRAYGHEHPMEDWCTSWEAYFYGAPGSTTPDPTHAWMAANMPGKFAIVDSFIRTHRR